MKLWTNQQLAHFPNSSRILDQWIVEAGEIFYSVIIHDELPIMDMPPVLQTSLDRRNDDELITRLSTVKSKLIYTAMKEIEPLIPSINIPTVEEFQSLSRKIHLCGIQLGNFAKVQIKVMNRFLNRNLHSIQFIRQFVIISIQKNIIFSQNVELFQASWDVVNPF